MTMSRRALWIASRRLTATSLRMTAAVPQTTLKFDAVAAATFSTNIYDQGSVTYSGGQATDGQGGYYGSGGARKKMDDEPHRPELLALASDVEHVHQVMDEVSKLEEILLENEADLNKSMEARGSIKKLMTSPDFMSTLQRLECVKGEPVWGLNQEERELIAAAREKVNAC